MLTRATRLGRPKRRGREAVAPSTGTVRILGTRFSRVPARDDYRSRLTLNRLHITIVVQLDAPGDWNSTGVFEPV